MESISNIVYRLIGERVKALRTRKGVSQEQLSRDLNLSRSSISNIEVGRHHVPVYVLYEISFILDVSLNDLLPSKKAIDIARNENKGVVGETTLDKRLEKQIYNYINTLGKDDNETD